VTCPISGAASRSFPAARAADPSPADLAARRRSPCPSRRVETSPSSRSRASCWLTAACRWPRRPSSSVTDFSPAARWHRIISRPSWLSAFSKAAISSARLAIQMAISRSSTRGQARIEAFHLHHTTHHNLTLQTDSMCRPRPRQSLAGFAAAGQGSAESAGPSRTEPAARKGPLTMRPSAFTAPGRFWRGNLHTHSTNSDGVLSPEEVCRRYRAEGYDFLAITDHFIGIYGYPMTTPAPSGPTASPPDRGRTAFRRAWRMASFGISLPSACPMTSRPRRPPASSPSRGRKPAPPSPPAPWPPGPSSPSPIRNGPA
jgi:hypothetical protein